MGRCKSLEERHLFECVSCRARRRLARSWKAYPRAAAPERPEPPGEDFVAKVLAAVRRDCRRRLRRRALLAAAAALLFFFFSGAGGQRASDGERIGDAYEEFAAPSLWPGVLPLD